MDKLKELPCKNCNGIMRTQIKAKNSQLVAIFLIITGIVLFCIPNLLILGIVVFLIGIFIGCGSKKYWICENCNTKIEQA